MQDDNFPPRFSNVKGAAHRRPPRAAKPPEPVHVEPEGEDNVLGLFKLIWRGKWVVMLAAFAAVLAGSYYVFNVATPEYSASTSLAFQVRNQQVVDIESVVAGLSTEISAINTELEIIRTPPLIKEMVLALNLMDDPEFNSRLRPEPAISRSKIKSVIRRLFTGSQAVEPVPPTEDDILEDVAASARSAVAVSAQRNTYVFSIRVTTQDPGKSVAMANTLAEIYLKKQIEVKFAATEYAVNWLSGRVTELEKSLKEKEDAIKNLRSNSDLVGPEALDALNQRFKNARTRFDEAEIDLDSARAGLAELKEVVATQNLEAIASHANDAILNRVVSGAVRNVARDRTAFFERVETLVGDAELALVRAQSQYDALGISVDRFQKQIDAQNEDLVALNKLVRDADSTRVLYETFLSRLKATSVQLGLQQADSRIMAAATRGAQIAPRTSRILAICFILGTLVGVAIVLLRETLQSGFRSADELEAMTGYTTLGQVPRIPVRGRSALIDYLRSKPTSAGVEAIRNIRTSIMLSNIDSPPQLIMSCSSIPNEGKTTLAISLAQNLSSLGKRVILIEGDLRRRTLSQYFAQPSKGSLVSVLRGEHTLAEAAVHDPKLEADVLMGEKSAVNAADLFASEKFANLLEELRAVYDYVILDMPPVLVVPDARVIGPKMDAIVFSVKWNSTGRDQVIDGIRQFSSTGTHITGLVLSQVDARRMKKYGYGGRYGAYASYGKGYYDT